MWRLGAWRASPLNYSKICKKVGQKAAILQEIATVFSVTFFVLVAIVGELVKTPPPPPDRRCLGTSMSLGCIHAATPSPSWELTSRRRSSVLSAWNAPWYLICVCSTGYRHYLLLTSQCDRLIHKLPFTDNVLYPHGLSWPYRTKVWTQNIDDDCAVEIRQIRAKELWWCIAALTSEAPELLKNSTGLSL